MIATRCKHDMLVFDGKGCADCLGLPDVPLIDDLHVDEIGYRRRAGGVDRDKRALPRLADECDVCPICRERIPDPHSAAWSATLAALVCAGCVDETD